jgi:V/A-type H+-transporting ATPase subunit D
MVIHPTRTNLLLLKDKASSVVNSVGILKARRQALIQEFLNTTRPFLKSRETIRHLYGRALDELAFSLGRDGKHTVEPISLVTRRDIRVNIIERSIWGLKYRDIMVNEHLERSPDERGYDFLSTTPHLEESIYFFEKVLESMLELAAFENKLKKLSDEILRIMRKIRVLEERTLPGLNHHIRTISQYISERERESFYRLKKFKTLRKEK